MEFTRNAYREGLWWFLRVGRNRAELLALHGRPVVAATIAGALEGLRSAGLRMASRSPSPLVDRAVTEHPEAVQRGRALTLEEAAALTLAELESVLADLEIPEDE